jgi:integrase
MGSVYRSEDGRRWRGAVTWTEPDGTRRRRVVSGRTAQEAHAKLDALRRELQLGSPLPKGRAPTVGEYLVEWIERNRSRVRPSTWLVREQHVRLWLGPALGRIPLARLSPADVERVLAEFLRSGRPRPETGHEGRGRRRAVSPLTVRHLRATLRMAFSDAVRDGLVNRNVAALARPPRVPSQPIAYLTGEQVRRLLDATAADANGPLYALLVGTGLRLGEALGLSWSDVDFDAGTLTVHHGMALRADGTFGLAEPKTLKSQRTIPLTTIARLALQRQRARQAEWRLAAGTAWQDRDGLVFTDSVGRGLRPPDLSRACANLRIPGLPKLRVHWLRHTFATAALAQGVGLATVSDLLGHSGVAITAQHYAAVVPELKRDAVAAIDRALAGTA